MSTFRTIAATITSVTVKTTGANVLGLNIVNGHSAVVYVKFYNTDVATFQDTPVYTIAVPATASVNQQATRENLFGTSEGLCVRAVTNFADGGNTAAATLPIIEVEYR